MSELFLVRHGQASFGEVNYDQLSPTGYQQSRWLGEHFSSLGLSFDRVITGSLARQSQTAVAILDAMGSRQTVEQHSGLDEFNFLSLAAVYSRLSNVPVPPQEHGPKPFFQMLRKAMKAWSLEELHDELGAPRGAEPESENADPASVLETWQQFHERVSAAMSEIRQSGDQKRILAISSGGAIAMALSQLMECSVDTLINLNLQAKNTGINHLFFNSGRMIISSVNNAPHLETPARRHAITYA